MTQKAPREKLVKFYPDSLPALDQAEASKLMCHHLTLAILYYMNTYRDSRLTRKAIKLLAPNEDHQAIMNGFLSLCINYYPEDEE